MFVAGLDIGSFFSRAVIMEEGRILSSSIRPTGGNLRKAVDGLLSDVLQSADLIPKRIKTLGACGLGASFIPDPFVKIAELSCLTRGIHHLLPDIRNVIEVGNQYSRVVKLNAQGKLIDSLVSDKCAAGSGRILQIIARVLGVAFDELGPLSIRSTRRAKFTTSCAVFLETEAISRIAEGTPIEDIVAGLHYTLTSKIATMATRLKITGDCAMTGGGALDSGLTQMIKKELDLKLHIPEQTMFTGAIGAALIAAERDI